MLFRPSFCCNCGEKIERAEWKLWTSRRFCALCATDFTLQELAVKAVILLASVVSIFGIVSYFNRNIGRADLVTARNMERPALANLLAERPATSTGPAPAAKIDNRAPAASNAIEDRRPQTLAAMPPNQTVKAPAVAADDTYICGAATKKGTPCSRRVKGNVRCYQHLGQPAMLPADQLRISR